MTGHGGARTPLTARQRLDRQVTEAQVQSAGCEALTRLQWVWVHHPDSRRANAGCPDVIAASHNGWVAFIEFKTELGKLRPEQTHWLECLGWWEPDGLVHVHYHIKRIVALVRPSNLDGFIDTLTKVTRGEPLLAVAGPVEETPR